LLLQTAPLTGQDCGPAPADTAGVLRVAHGIIAADNDRSLEKVLGFYRLDAVLLPPGEPMVRGRDEIRPRYAALFARYDPAIAVRIETADVCGSLAVVTGRNTGTLQGRGGASDRPVSDAFVMVLRRDSSSWRIAHLIWHPDGR
jgi:uncharacterized protein (TIGR02246 family)